MSGQAKISHKEQQFELIAAAIAVVFAAGFSFYIVGELLNLLATGSFTGTSPANALSLGIRVVLHPGNPAIAWPDETRPHVAAAVFWLAWLGLGWMIFRAIRATGFRWGKVIDRYGRPDSARWANDKELSRLYVTKPGDDYRIVLGTQGKNLVATNPTDSTIVFGPPGSYKTAGLVIPTLLEWQGLAVVTSVKSDLLNETIAARRQMGNVFIFDPSNSVVGRRTHGWNPLARCKSWEGAQKTAKSLVSAAKQATGGSSDNEIWYQSAQTLLAPYLYAAALADYTIGQVLDWLDAQESDEVRQELFDIKDNQNDRPWLSLKAILEYAPEQRSSIFFTAATAIEAYRAPSVLDSSRRSEITPEALFDGGANTLYVCAPPADQKTMQPMFTALLEQIRDFAFGANFNNAAIDPPLLYLLDECANIAPIKDLDQLATTGRGVGIRLMSIFQDYGQVRKGWGQEAANTILGAHVAKLILPGIADPHTLEWIRTVTGEQEVRQYSYTDGHHSKSSTDSLGYRPITPANAVREMETGEALLIYNNTPLTKLRVRPWFEDRRLRSQVERAKAEDPQRIDPTEPRERPGRPPRDAGGAERITAIAEQLSVDEARAEPIEINGMQVDPVTGEVVGGEQATIFDQPTPAPLAVMEPVLPTRSDVVQFDIDQEEA